jgi:hypothetical protein
MAAQQCLQADPDDLVIVDEHDAEIAHGLALPLVWTPS